MEQIIKHMLNRGLSMGWRGWADMVADRHEALDALRKSAAFMMNRKLGQGWRGWRAAHESAAKRELAMRGVTRFINRGSARLRGRQAAWSDSSHSSRRCGAAWAICSIATCPRAGTAG